MYEPSQTDKLTWEKLKDEREKCERLWKKAMVADAALEKLCLQPSGEFTYDPIAMIMACISDMKKFETAEDPVWQASFRAAKTQLAFNKYIRLISKRYNVPILLIRQHCDSIDPKKVLGNEASRYWRLIRIATPSDFVEYISQLEVISTSSTRTLWFIYEIK